MLATVFCTSIILTVALQLLATKSERDGGILFAATVKNFSSGQSFVYIYLPVVITVLYGLVWTWIDLDARRLEPYYAMAESRGATAEKSLFLDYTSVFVAYIPIKAAILK